MLPISRVIVSLVYYNSLIRDTLEYTINREKFDVKFYDYKKHGIINEPLLNTPLKQFLDNNGEKGEELRKLINEFGEALYSEKSTILRPEADNVHVDHNQDVTIFEKVVPLHEQITAVIRLHDKYRKDHNQVEESITKLLDADEEFYRGVLLFTLSNQIFRKFDEFNKNMREGHGEKTPAASFVEQELQTLTRMFFVSKVNATCKDNNYTEALDATEHMIEMMNGRRELPKGKNFRDVYVEVNAKCNALLLISEDQWKQTYQPAVNEMIKHNQAARAQAEANKASEDNGENK